MAHLEKLTCVLLISTLMIVDIAGYSYVQITGVVESKEYDKSYGADNFHPSDDECEDAAKALSATWEECSQGAKARLFSLASGGTKWANTGLIWCADDCGQDVYIYLERRRGRSYTIYHY